MKGDHLGEFEELALLAVRALGPETYGVPVQRFVERSTGRAVSMGAVYAALDRLEDKGFVRSVQSGTTPARGGKRRRLFAIAPAGVRMLVRLRQVRERMWQAVGET
jgi:DNA-binding PadR family transcriptional regulator